MKRAIKISTLLGVSILLIIFVNTINVTDSVNNKEDSVFAVYIDGVKVPEIPSTNYYDLSSYSCQNNSVLSWDKINRKLSFSSLVSSNVETCTLNFTTSSFSFLLRDAPLGSYVSYTGTNGCPTTEITGAGEAKSADACRGKNANQNSETLNGVYGYCKDSTQRFSTYGWRLAYTYDSDSNGIREPYIVSAGSPECIQAYYAEYHSSEIGYPRISTYYNFYYSNSYSYDKYSGKYMLDGDMISGKWGDTQICTSYSCPILTNGYIYTCTNTGPNEACDNLYVVNGWHSSNAMKVYNYYSETNTEVFLNRLNTLSLKYCNSNYAYGSICGNTYSSYSSNAWVINNSDFNKISSQWLGVSKGLTECLNYSEKSKECGLNSDILDNGGKYRFGLLYPSTQHFYEWDNYYKMISKSMHTMISGLRPVIHLKDDIFITGGSGTMEEPYIINYE